MVVGKGNWVQSVGEQWVDQILFWVNSKGIMWVYEVNQGMA